MGNILQKTRNFFYISVFGSKILTAFALSRKYFVISPKYLEARVNKRRKVLIFSAFLHILHYVENVTDFKTPKEFQFCLLQVPLMVGHNETIFERYKTVMLIGIGLICSENIFAYWSSMENEAKSFQTMPIEEEKDNEKFQLTLQFWMKKKSTSPQIIIFDKE